MEIWDTGSYNLQKHIYSMGEEMQACIQAYLGKDLDIMDIWDVEELAKVLTNMRIIRGIVTAILLKNKNKLVNIIFRKN